MVDLTNNNQVEVKGGDGGDNGMGMNRSWLGHQKSCGQAEEDSKSYHLGTQNTRQEQ